MRLGGSVPLLSAQCIFCQLAAWVVDLSKNILLFVVRSDITGGIASERPKLLTAMKTIVSHLSRVCNEHLLLTKMGTPSWVNESP